jgi:hypothetical protein
LGLQAGFTLRYILIKEKKKKLNIFGGDSKKNSGGIFGTKEKEKSKFKLFGSGEPEKSETKIKWFEKEEPKPEKKKFRLFPDRAEPEEEVQEEKKFKWFD